MALTLFIGLFGTIFGAQFLFHKLQGFHPKKIARTADWIHGCLILLIIVASLLPYFKYTILILSFMSMTLLAIHRNCEQYIIKDAIHDSDQNLATNFNAVFELSTHLGRVLGPLVVAIVFALANVRAALAFDALTFFLSAALLTKLQLDYSPPKEKIPLKKSLKSYPLFKLVTYLGLPFCIQTALSLFVATFVVHLTQTLSTPPQGISVFQAVEALALIGGIFVAPHFKRFKMILPVAILMISLGYLGFYFACISIT